MKKAKWTPNNKVSKHYDFLKHNYHIIKINFYLKNKKKERQLSLKNIKQQTWVEKEGIFKQWSENREVLKYLLNSFKKHTDCIQKINTDYNQFEYNANSMSHNSKLIDTRIYNSLM